MHHQPLNPHVQSSGKGRTPSHQSRSTTPPTARRPDHTTPSTPQQLHNNTHNDTATPNVRSMRRLGQPQHCTKTTTTTTTRPDSGCTGDWWPGWDRVRSTPSIASRRVTPERCVHPARCCASQRWGRGGGGRGGGVGGRRSDRSLLLLLPRSAQTAVS